MYDLSRLTLKEITECGAELRALGSGAPSMESAAGRVVRHLYDGFGTGEGGARAHALVRCFKTHTYSGLEPAQQEFVRGVMGGEPTSPGISCLTLLATVGDTAEWNSRHLSKSHVAIPLPSAQTVERLPMVARLVRQLGLDVSSLVTPPSELLLDHQETTFGVFHVADAARSPYIPAQETFVAPYGIRSVLGFGGLLPGGDLFAVILFARVAVSVDTAKLFKPLALSVKLAILPFAAGPVFEAPATRPAAPEAW